MILIKRKFKEITLILNNKEFILYDIGVDDLVGIEHQLLGENLH